MLERALARILAAVLGPPITSLERAVGEWWRAYRTESWPSAFGNVQTADISQTPGLIWRATMAYSYSVAGEFYSGYLTQEFARERDVDDFVHRFPSGRRLFVRYNPTKPEKSLLRLQENGNALMPG